MDVRFEDHSGHLTAMRSSHVIWYERKEDTNIYIYIDIDMYEHMDSIPGTQACSAQCKSQPRSPCQGWISHVCLRGSIHTSVWSLCSQGSVQGFSAVRAQDSTPQLPVFSSIGGSGLPTSSPCQRRRTPHQMARIVDSQKSSSPFRLYIHIYMYIY